MNDRKSTLHRTDATPDQDRRSTRRYYVRDPRQKSVITGKVDGGWLRNPPAPAVWVKTRGQAQSFTAEEIEAIKKGSPYFDGCEVIPAEENDR